MAIQSIFTVKSALSKDSHESKYTILKIDMTVKLNGVTQNMHITGSWIYNIILLKIEWSKLYHFKRLVDNQAICSNFNNHLNKGIEINESRWAWMHIISRSRSRSLKRANIANHIHATTVFLNVRRVDGKAKLVSSLLMQQQFS